VNVHGLKAMQLNAACNEGHAVQFCCCIVLLLGLELDVECNRRSCAGST
jgi:hypothetical protein